MTHDQFICQACGTAFPSRAELDQHHQREHAATDNTRQAMSQQAIDGVKCPICGAQFSDSAQLGRHTRQEHQT